MAQAATATKPDAKLLKERNALADELVGIHRKHADVFARVDDIKSRLRAIAGIDGENFKVDMPGKGAVKVSAPKPEKMTGTQPEVVVEVFYGLPQREQERLTEKGVVKIAEVWKKAYYGSVTVEVY